MGEDIDVLDTPIQIHTNPLCKDHKGGVIKPRYFLPEGLEQILSGELTTDQLIGRVLKQGSPKEIELTEERLKAIEEAIASARKAYERVLHALACLILSPDTTFGGSESCGGSHVPGVSVMCRSFEIDPTRLLLRVTRTAIGDIWNTTLGKGELKTGLLHEVTTSPTYAKEGNVHGSREERAALVELVVGERRGWYRPGKVTGFLCEPVRGPLLLENLNGERPSHYMYPGLTPVSGSTYAYLAKDA